MRIVDVLCAPWAIMQDRLLEINQIYATHLRGEKIDIRAIEARIGAPLKIEPEPFEVVDGVAVIPVEGIIAKRMNLFTQISGGVSTQLLERDFKQALNDPAVHAIVLNVDSPGGSVDGTLEMARVIREARGAKPIVALADGLMASAAYWIGSAADRVLITGETTDVGSIGVIATHIDWSRMDEMRGLKVTEITAGKFKAVGSPDRPLDALGKDTIQVAVDRIYSVFVQDVAEQRGVSVETVLEKMADGRIFMGSQAIEAGLVDGVSTLPALIRLLNDEKEAAATGAVAPKQQTGGRTMDPATTEDAVITAEEVKAKETAAFDKGKTDGIAEGATAELERIKAVAAEGKAMPGHEALVEELMFDGKTTGPEAAQKILAAESKARKDKLDEIKTDAPEPVPGAAAPANEKPGQEADPQRVAKAARDYQAEQKTKGIDVSAADAVRHVEKNGLAD